MSDEGGPSFIVVVLAILVAAVAVFGVWRVADGLSLVLGWRWLAAVALVAAGVLGTAWLALRRTRPRQ